nr:hypothetical protein [Tanacetum cinerariifolium]
MRTCSSSNLPVESPPNPSTSNPKRRNGRRSKQHFILEESPIDTMTDQCTMAELLRAPTEGYAEAIVVPLILAEQFELKHCLINMMTSDRFFRLEKDNPHDHIHWFNKITSTIKYKDVPNSKIKLMLFPFSLAGAARRWLEKEHPCSILTWEDLVSKFINEFFPPQEQQISVMKFQTFNNAILKQFQATPPPAFVKAVEEICVTCGGAHPYYQCLAADGNTFPELRDNIQGYVAAVAINYNQGNSIYRPSGSRSLPSNTIANPNGELKAITTRSGIVLDGPSVPIPPSFIKPEEDEHVEETLTDQDLAEMLKQKQQEKDEVQIHKFWQMFKQLHINITLADALILIPKYQKMLKALLSNKEKLLELSNTPLNENYSTVILKKLPERLGDPGKFLISCGFDKVKCKALADLAGIARDVFVWVGKFTFPADFVIVDYESDSRVPLVLGRPFLRTARALIDVHGEERILRDDDVFDPDQVLKPFFPSPIPVEDIDSFLEKSDTSLSLPEYDNFIDYTEETSNGNSDFTPSDNSLPEFETLYFDIEEKNSGSTIIHADMSLLDFKSFNFDFKPDPGELTSIVDSEICENVPSATNETFPPEEDHSPLFSYVVWIVISFLTYSVVPPHLFSFGNEDTIFDPDIANYHFPSLLSDVSHRCETFKKFNVYPKLLNESLMKILSSSCSHMEQ